MMFDLSKSSGVESDDMACHICGGKCEEFLDFRTFRQIASDCQPYKRGGQLTICQDCGMVQRPLSANWEKATGEIYSDYQLFSQSLQQSEEVIFQSTTGESKSRSGLMFSWLDGVCEMPLSGSLLDVGCGAGGLLASFSNYRPQWNLTGLDIGENAKSMIEKIPNSQFIQGSLEALHREAKYDLITLSHTFEHLPNPLLSAKMILEHLSEDGLLFIQGPILESAPFDILVADHRSFFTEKTLSYTLQRSGFEIMAKASNYLPKEVSVLARRQKYVFHEHSHDHEFDYQLDKEMVQQNLDFLSSIREQAWQLKSSAKSVGIFGSSISSSWLFGEFEEAEFFVDENPQRIGSHHLGLPILSPSALSNDHIVLMPFRPDIAASIANRLHTTLELNDIFILPKNGSVG